MAKDKSLAPNMQADQDVWLAYHGRAHAPRQDLLRMHAYATLIAGKEAWQEKVNNLN